MGSAEKPCPSDTTSALRVLLHYANAQREELMMILRRKKVLAELTRERAKADCKQRSAKRKQKQRGGGVRESMEKNKLIAHNKEKWLAMCKNRDKRRDDQESTREDDKAGGTQGKSDKGDGEDRGNSTLPGSWDDNTSTSGHYS